MFQLELLHDFNNSGEAKKHNKNILTRSMKRTKEQNFDCCLNLGSIYRGGGEVLVVVTYAN